MGLNEVHDGVWVSLGLPPANTLASSRQDLNNLGGSVGLLVQSPSDAGAMFLPATSQQRRNLANVLAAITARFN